MRNHSPERPPHKMRFYNLNIIAKIPRPLDKCHKDITANVSGSRLTLIYDQKVMFYFMGAITLIVAVIMLLSNFRDALEQWPLLVGTGLIGVALIFFGKKMPDKYWMLDRLNQQITIPYILSYKQTTLPIQDVISGYYSTSGKSRSVTVPTIWHNSNLMFKNRSDIVTWKPFDVDDDRTDEDITWSFYIWFLDKNRPLPPGDLLDPFRDEDFKRRKEEGFPPPLFCSCIPTPEATPEQQVEREKYWNDEEYMSKADRYKKESVFGKKKTHLIVEKDAVIIHDANLPEDWSWASYPEIENFKYLDTAYAMRYEFKDGSIKYAYINNKTEEVFTPPKSIDYNKEIVRNFNINNSIDLC